MCIVRPDPVLLRTPYYYEEGDSDFFVKAVGDVARAKGMVKVARTTGLGRQNLYRPLSRGGNPRVGTLFRVLDALDVRLSVAR